MPAGVRWLLQHFSQLQHSMASMLVDQAGVLLQNLRDRDSRRRFCQPALWVAPFVEMQDGWGRARAAPGNPEVDSSSSIWAFSTSSVAQWIMPAQAEEGPSGASTSGDTHALYVEVALQPIE